MAVLGGSNFPTGQLPGTATNDNASAGNVGEYMESIIAVGSAVALTTAVTSNVTSLSLTAGDWDVVGSVIFNPGATTSITALIASICLTTATIDGTYAWSHRMSAFVPNAPFGGYGIARRRVSINATTSVFLTAQGVFTVSTLGAYGYINARRVR